MNTMSKILLFLVVDRQLLRQIMTEAGWIVEPSEWWHFNAMPLEKANQELVVIQ